jgi:hypothetical protein
MFGRTYRLTWHFLLPVHVGLKWRLSQRGPAMVHYTHTHRNVRLGNILQLERKKNAINQFYRITHSPAGCSARLLLKLQLFFEEQRRSKKICKHYRDQCRQEL